MPSHSNNSKNNNGRFRFFHSKKEYKDFLEKCNDDISTLNKKLKQAVLNYMSENKNTSYEETRKDIYISADENDAITSFCNKKKISRSRLAELSISMFKSDIFNSSK